MSVSIEEYKGSKASCNAFTMTSSWGASAKIIEYGCRITELIIPDKDGNKADIMLGLRDLDSYIEDGYNHGAVVGRSANRIAGAKYTIDGVNFTAPLNDVENNLHGGSPSYQNVFWDGRCISKSEADELLVSSRIEGIPQAEGDAVLLHYVSPDGACGFPGNLDSYILYAWLTDRTLMILYKATSDKKTIFCPTNHSYFNLGGHNSGCVGDNLLWIDADRVTYKVNRCPNGDFIDVDGTIFDFRKETPVKTVLTLDDEQTRDSLGIDQNFCLNHESGRYDLVAILKDDKSSRVMEVLTDMPCMQVYAGNHLSSTKQKGDIPYKPYDAICLEAQMYPNAVNVPAFPSYLIDAGKTAYHVCGYRFK